MFVLIVCFLKPLRGRHTHQRSESMGAPFIKQLKEDRDGKVRNSAVGDLAVGHFQQSSALSMGSGIPHVKILHHSKSKEDDMVSPRSSSTLLSPGRSQPVPKMSPREIVFQPNSNVVVAVDGGGGSGGAFSRDGESVSNESGGMEEEPARKEKKEEGKASRESTLRESSRKSEHRRRKSTKGQHDHIQRRKSKSSSSTVDPLGDIATETLAEVEAEIALLLRQSQSEDTKK